MNISFAVICIAAEAEVEGDQEPEAVDAEEEIGECLL